MQTEISTFTKLSPLQPKRRYYSAVVQKLFLVCSYVPVVAYYNFYYSAILLCDRLLDDEVVIIKGCRRFCTYTGYLYSFAFKDIIEPPVPPQDIIVIDAVFSLHFERSQNLRDLTKAYLGFQPEEGFKISTGTYIWRAGRAVI